VVSLTSSDADRSTGRTTGPPPSVIVWMLLALTLVGIVFLSLAPVPDPDLPGPLEHLPHAAAYAALTGLLLTATLWRPAGRGRVPWLGATVVTLCLVILGSTLELAQAVVGRDIEVADTVANVVGILAALAAWLLFWILLSHPVDPPA